jgi:hypothetical protein
VRVAVEIAREPVAVEIAVVDPWVARIDEREPVAVEREQLLDQRIGQHDCTGGPTQLGGRKELIRIGADIDVPRTKLGEGIAGSGTCGRIRLCAQRQPDSTERCEPVPCTVAERDNVGGQLREHQRPPNAERATSIRCTSIVPDATVAAWA